MPETQTGVRLALAAEGSANVTTGLPVLDHLVGSLRGPAAFASRSRWRRGAPTRQSPRPAARSAAPSAISSTRLGASGCGWALVPSAEALAAASLERDTEPRLVSNVEFSHQRVGGLAADVASVFLREAADAAQINLHVRLLEGTDPQHVLTAIYKAVGAALGQACRPRHHIRGGGIVKEAVRTEAAPAPFQGAPYSQAIKAGGFVFVSGQLALGPATRICRAARSARRPSSLFANLRAILEAAGSSLDQLVKTTVFLQNLDDFAGMNEVYAQVRRRHAAGTLDGRGREAARRVRSSRSRRSQSSERIEKYVASLGLDAYVVGGAVRDELLGVESKDADFLVPGVDIAGLRAPLAPHGRTEELVVAGRPVGVRHYPRDRALRALVPGGHRAGAAAARGLDRPRPPRLRDRRRPGGADRRRPRPPRLHDQRDGAPSRRRRADRSVRRRGGSASAAPADGLAVELRRGSAAARARPPASSRSSISTPTHETLAQMREEATRRAARLGRANRRRPARRRDGRAVEAPARQAAGARRFGSHATPACSSSCCPSSSRRSGSSRRAATTT